MKKILIIDDEIELLQSMKFSLEAEGFSVAVCSDCRLASEQACTLNPDLIITDLMMPFLSGYEVILALREAEETKAIPILLMSSVIPAAKQKHFGWNAFLRKPFDNGALLQAVRALLT